MGIVRLLFYVIVGYLVYLFVRAFLRKSDKTGNKIDGETQGAKRLEEDPVCGVYISRETAIRRVVDEKEIFFCSEQCAGRYLADANKKH